MTVDNPDPALDHLADRLSQRFPDVGRDRIDRQVHDTYAALERTSVDDEA